MFVIRVTDGSFVTSYRPDLGLIVRCKSINGALRFKDLDAAEAFIAEHADAGYGLLRRDCVVLRVTPSGQLALENT